MRAFRRKEYLAQAHRLLWSVLVRGRYDYTFDLMPMRIEHMPLRKRLNLLASGMNLLYRRVQPWSMPINLQVEVTSVCNLRCPVCPTGKGLLSRREALMDLATYETLMRETGDTMLAVMLWAWGEPLLHPQFADFVRIAREHGVLPLLSTNGQNLDREAVVNGLLHHPPEHLIVALDGLTDETNSVYRVGARLEPALRGVRRLAELKRQRGQTRPWIHLRFIVMKHNEHEVPQAEAFAREHGFDYLSLRGLSIIADPEEQSHARMVPAQAPLQAYAYASGQRVQRSDYLCQHAFAFPAVLTDGTVVVCDQDFNASRAYGRLGQEGQTFRDIWYGARAAQVRREVRDHRELSSFCRLCPYADRPLNTCNVQVIKL
jgi:MoaA/NifB/PqqE/SkfB family radical SAM enzyme